MIAIGETLRHERLRKNLDLNEISRELKIAPRFLEAIEDEQFDRLPGTVFAKAFVLQYAKLLGIGEGELAGQVQQRFEPVMQTPQLAETTHSSAPIHVPPVEEWEPGGEHKFTWPSWIPAAGMVVVAMLACSFIYAWWQRDRHTVSAQTTTAAEQSSELAPAPTPATPEPPTTQDGAARSAEPAPQQPTQAAPAAPVQTPPAAQTPVTTAAGLAAVTPATAPPVGTAPASSGADAASPNPTATVHVAVTAEEQAWISARSDGKSLFSGTLEANETRTLEGNGTVTVRVGNAGGVSITLNGRPIGPVGSKGQTRTIQFTSGGFQIVAAPKPSSPVPAPI